eukprot:3623059-Pleurochrysis_carterae.AAC.4
MHFCIHTCRNAAARGMVTTHRRRDWRARARTRRRRPPCARACRGSGGAHMSEAWALEDRRRLLF